MRRDSNDLEWKATKEAVKVRDRNTCRLLKVLSVQEAILLMKKSKGVGGSLDPAHILAVGSYPNLCYEPNNVVMLNHYSHTLLDSCKDPISGKPISKEEANEWWIRILKGDKNQYKFFEENDLLRILED